ncbi:Defensin-like (DEFL) family protein [Arabidopsis thaliana]|uniref:Defensin-like (DEFL) family protein n=1 Tax=Arabidopsis thaliana TaxID=3702 RepID=Q2V333_ARATH|nr:Defensin-like (DEFL) family protein [Arabidopsis thaliana]AED93943.1 Defensin-like (DEFL) family protein [Arabidopsis thaliana]|eukprot:NP_001031967.1 Defensin-like (DEFL) family protein [Arabidopsis thaliana]
MKKYIQLSYKIQYKKAPKGFFRCRASNPNFCSRFKLYCILYIICYCLSSVRLYTTYGL